MKNSVPVIVTHPSTIIRDGLQQILVSKQFRTVYALPQVDDETIKQFASASTCVWLFVVDDCKSSARDSVRHVRQIAANIKSVILTRHTTANDVLQALDAGVCGVLSQSISRKNLIKSLELIALGEVVVPGDLFGSENSTDKATLEGLTPSQISTVPAGTVPAGLVSTTPYFAKNGASSYDANGASNGWTNGGIDRPQDSKSGVANGVAGSGHNSASANGSVNAARDKAGNEGVHFDGGTLPSTMCDLSKRETAILGLLTEGASNKAIARQLVVTEATVKVHVKAILRKLRLQNRTQAAIWANENLRMKYPATSEVAAARDRLQKLRSHLSD